LVYKGWVDTWEEETFNSNSSDYDDLIQSSGKPDKSPKNVKNVSITAKKNN